MPATNEHRKIILDCDPGHDDAVAILLAAGNPAIELVGVTTIGGNQTLEKVTRNARTVLRTSGRAINNRSNTEAACTGNRTALVCHFGGSDDSR